MTDELSKGFTGIEINGVRFSNLGEMLRYMDKQRDRIIDLEKENAELKEIIKTYYDNFDEAEFYSLRKKAEQFLKGESTAEQPNECHDCVKFDEMPKGPRCKTCDNGSHFQKKEEA